MSTDGSPVSATAGPRLACSKLLAGEVDRGLEGNSSGESSACKQDGQRTQQEAPDCGQVCCGQVCLLRFGTSASRIFRRANRRMEIMRKYRHFGILVLSVDPNTPTMLCVAS
ncbi:hypothetical protein LQG66_31925 [Bradyrhizobium ontarionense]|uniref:Uncharacterized protein n=1 Tax=Bradyrhizobium ontarionense TaxID=2898149 RepID=A0ABY3R9Y0_9BRAD|nr:hypothetical protein [Bradyrhizobium sp. A19]UFZ03764.1 hypothetical protein LQG66_31925 [Bradyrhizobium sp. A19]